LSWIGVLVGVGSLLIAVSVALAGFATFRVTRQSGATNAYKATSEAWESRANVLSQQVADLQAALGAEREHTRVLEGKVQVLTDLATGESDRRQLAARVEELYGDMMRQCDAILGAVRDGRTAA
jgi:hypothetical protein